jgi:hypothetical protein
MKVNEGKLDRGIRIAAGLTLIGLSVAGVLGPWGYLGVIPVITGSIGMCPLYSMLGINTCSLPRP